MKVVQLLIILSLNLTFIGLTYADYDAGKSKAEACAACHGADGNSQITIYPKLAGQYKNYLINTLSSYKSGSRKNAIMNGFAAGLSDQDIEDLSEYFSKQDGLKVLPVK
jgi:cytochrome c553|tara:strand:- start:186 stop:512 length:327 start_codon:yes stop_codon:yes gene_type:complete